MFMRNKFIKKTLDNRLKIITFILLALLLTLSAVFYENKALSIHFVDEEDNFVIGKYLLKGEKLYGDLFSHHQPLGYILSAGVQQITDPNSIYLLVKRHREALIIWSAIWVTIITLRFGLRGIIVGIFYEFTKIIILGNLFLSESIVVYPLVYLFLLSLGAKNKISKIEVFLVGATISFCFLILAPIWPLLLLISLLLIYKTKKNFILLFLGGLIPLIVCLNFISLPDYFHDAFYINLNYYVPNTSTAHFSPISIIQSFFTPLLAFNDIFSNSTYIWIIRLFLIILIINMSFLAFKKEKITLLIFLVLGLANIRYINPGETFYRGFHILPWHGLLIATASTLIFFSWEKIKSKFLNIANGILLISTFIVCFFFAGEYLFKKSDVANDLYVNYSRQFSIGEAVRIMKTSEEDTLFVAPDEWLVYWQADTSHASKMLNYYKWMTQVPELRNLVIDKFEEKPPVFFYYHEKGLGLEQYLSFYQEVKKDGQNTGLYVLPERLNNLKDSQIADLKFYGFTLD